jgi:hypothetical protein
MKPKSLAEIGTISRTLIHDFLDPDTATYAARK